jgi:Phytanoyl-CoA dioxygenase (PhyH)
MPSRLALEVELSHWKEHGWTFFESLIGREEIEAAAGELGRMYPTADEFARDVDAQRNDRFRIAAKDTTLLFEDIPGPAFRRLQFAGNEDFPFPGNLLNRLVVHPSLVHAAEHLLGTSEIRLYQSQCVAKYTGATNYEQPLHLDYSTHTLLTPQPYQQVEMFVYLRDVTPDLAPTHVVSRTLTRNRSFVPKAVMPAFAPDLYAAETSAPGPAGSVFLYGPDTWHRGVNLRKPGGARFWLALSFCRAGQEWLGFQAFPRAGLRAEWRSFVEHSTPRQLALFGIPMPGHSYWTEKTVSEFAARYPALDVGPWRAHLKHAEAPSIESACRRLGD